MPIARPYHHGNHRLASPPADRGIALGKSLAALEVTCLGLERPMMRDLASSETAVDMRQSRQGTSARAVHPGWLELEPRLNAVTTDESPETARYNALMQLFRTAGALDRAATDVLADLDLTAGAFGALIALDEVGEAGIAPSELARRLAVARRTATLYVDILARHGWAERHAHPSDRRMVLAVLTPLGHQLLDELGAAYKRRLGALLAELSPLQAERLRQLVSLIPLDSALPISTWE